MSIESEFADIPGGSKVLDWFGRVPRFHDAIILELTLRNSKESCLRIHAWNMTNEVDQNGFFVLAKHAVVTISAHHVTSIQLDDFDTSAIIFDLTIRKHGDQYTISWSSSYGISESFKAKKLRMELQPGKPVESHV